MRKRKKRGSQNFDEAVSDKRGLWKNAVSAGNAGAARGTSTAKMNGFGGPAPEPTLTSIAATGFTPLILTVG